MIGPPGLPKIGRRVFQFARSPHGRQRASRLVLKWAGGLYFAGVLAHFSHHMAFDLPAGTNPSLDAALAGAPMSLVWPADLIGTLLTLS
jgi:hypothetical protein